MKKGIYIFFSLIVLAVPSLAQHSDYDLIGEKDHSLYESLIQIQWNEEINESNIKLIKAGLNSENHILRKKALIAASIHGTSKFESELRMIQQKEGRVEQIPINQIQNKSLKDFNFDLKLDEELSSSFNKNLFQILFVRKVLNNRKSISNTIDLNQYNLTPVQSKVLEFSLRKNNEVTLDIINTISSSEGMTLLNSLLYDVLKTYPKESVKVGLSKFLDISFLTNATPTGKEYLLRTFIQELNYLSIQEKESLLSFLREEKNVKQFFNNNQLEMAVVVLRDKITNTDSEETKKKIAKYFDNEGLEEMRQKIQDKIDEAERKKKLNPPPPPTPDRSMKRYNRTVRPEEMGQDFSGYSKEKLIEYLSTSKDDVELKKAAQVLGDKDLANQLTLNRSDKNVIQRIVTSNLKRYKSKVIEDKEEAAQQIRRLWHLAAPTLLSVLENETDLKKIQLASNLLVDMRSEEIIKTIIKKAYMTKDVKYKKFYKYILSNMKSNRTIYLPNRKCISIEESEEIFDRVIKPALLKLDDQIKRK